MFKQFISSRSLIAIYMILTIISFQFFLISDENKTMGTDRTVG
jgi:hypothetical protein